MEKEIKLTLYVGGAAACAQNAGNKNARSGIPERLCAVCRYLPGTPGIPEDHGAERKQRVEKLLNILKMRGCRHSKDIFQYEIETGGLALGKKFEL
jgi:hypothetical protein